MNLILIISIFIAHFIADFIFQDEKWATNKSKSFRALLAHTFMYSTVLITFGYCYLSYEIIMNDVSREYIVDMNSRVLLFGFITLVFHTVTDFFTSKLTSKLYSQGKFGSEIPNFGFFTVIGFDQVLHYIQLYVLFYHLFIK